MPKRSKKIKIKKKIKKRRAVKEHDKNCIKCIKYSCLTEKVIDEDLEKRSKKAEMKDPDFKLNALLSRNNNVDINEIKVERIASLRPRRSLQNTDEEDREVKTEDEQPATKPPFTEFKYKTTPNPLINFLINKPKGMTKPKLEFIIPKIPMVINKVPVLKNERSSSSFPTFEESSTFFIEPPSLTPEMPQLNEYSLVSMKFENT